MKRMRIASTILFIGLASTVYSRATNDATETKPQTPNVLLICVDDLRPELNSFGADYITSPHIDTLASQGRAFTRHYVQAPTCGASRYALLTGRYGSASNDALFQRAKTLPNENSSASPSMPYWFRKHGYTTVSVGKVSHHPGGLGGPDWDDEAIPEMPNSWDRHILKSGPWQHPRGWMHGLANGEIRTDPSQMDVIQSIDGPDTLYPDGSNTDIAIKELESLAAQSSEKPFFLAFGILRPHLPFGAPAKYMELYQDRELPPVPHPHKPLERSTWHQSTEFYRYNHWDRDPNEDPEFSEEVRRHYASCVTFADAQVGRILQRLDELELRENTIVVLWGDHGWHLGEHGIWGKHALFEESLRSPLIINYPGMPKPGEASNSLVETVDIFPTIADLAGLPNPSNLSGVSLSSILETPTTTNRPAYSYYRKAKTIRTQSHRLIVHDDGYLELYDHTTSKGETKNLAKEHPKLAQELLHLIENRTDH